MYRTKDFGTHSTYVENRETTKKLDFGHMAKKYKGKYRIDTTRAKWWDYSQNGTYFITLNTLNRERFFGIISKGKMNLSNIGKIAQHCWEEIPNHFPFVNLGAFVIMPDHVHGILNINKKKKVDKSEKQYSTNTFGPQSKNLASVIRGYKIGVTKSARKTVSNFTWQSRYHDHIIRNPFEYKRIENYIIDNPKNWVNS
ncbi:transposase [Allomuricauda sp. CP2A]|jgi:REP element-mobilizing transposase RayT|uniref:transposase n=1 Tax=Allomuricauda sp. CP2A TaxID=1848189 RepID=UPI00210020DE|nr:transposase [Muricauda sp. CP2A]